MALFLETILLLTSWSSEFVLVLKSNLYTLVQWNVIMYANVTLPLTLVSNKLNVPFFSALFQYDLSCNCFQVHIWRNHAKIVNKFSKLYLTRLSQEPISRSSLQFRFHCTTMQWQMLPLRCHIFLIGNTHRRYCITCMRDRPIHALIGLWRRHWWRHLIILLYQQVVTGFKQTH